jgi:two-component system response regulator (stage 0 sporulation protein F)
MTAVLIVDDNESIRRSMRLILEDAGYETFQASDGFEAYDLLATHAEGMVVLLDLAMPGVDGPRFLEEFKKHPSLVARHAIVVVSVYADAKLPPRLVNLLTDLEVPVLGKPFDLDDLLAAVTRAEQRCQRAEVPMAPPTPPVGGSAP